jgi:hypothetical protein
MTLGGQRRSWPNRARQIVVGRGEKGQRSGRTLREPSEKGMGQREIVGKDG